MQIHLPFDFPLEPKVFMRRCGYAVFDDPNTGITSFVKRFGGDFYPRFHCYVEEKDGRRTINLHLDQKKPSYAGAHAHNADYDGPVVEKEADRIKGLIKNQLDNNQQQLTTESPNQGFWAKLFNK